VTSKIAAAIEHCSVPGLDIQFAFCNLSEAAIFRLAEAVERNRSLKGFSCFQNPCNFPDGENYDPNTRAEQRVRQALIDSPVPLEIWNDNPLPGDIKAARQGKKVAKPVVLPPAQPLITAPATVRAKAIPEDSKVHVVLAELKKTDLDADDQIAYAKLLVEAGYTSSALMKRLNETKIRNVGITKSAHVDVIMDFVTALNTVAVVRTLDSMRVSKTVMISYQWDSQPLAFRVRDFFEQHEIHVIIDRGGIKADFLDWMADAVKRADVMFLIITPKYAESKNCKAEATFAHEKKKKIVPLVGERGFTGGDGWLSILIAGKIRYDIVDDFNNSLETIVERELDV